MGDNQVAAAIPIVIPIQDGREMEKNQNGLGVGEASGPSYTLDQTGAQSVAYSVREDATANTFSATQIDVANAVTALQPSPQSHHAQTFITQSRDDLFSFDTQFGSNATVFNEQSPTLKATQAPSSIAYQYDGYNQKLEEGDGVYRSLRVGRDPSDFVMQSMSMVIRRLTPLECERLMGWPDDHTKFDADGRILPDTQRYKMCGNGIASPVARWVGEKLKVFI
jgi:site-specific DNA-cytosine methylase